MAKHRLLKVNLIPSVADLFFVAIFLLLFFSAKSPLLKDGDTGYHIRAGDYIIDTLSIPRQDIFSFHAPPMPWTAHEWLSEVIMALVHRIAGLTGIVALFSFLLALTGYLLFKILRSYRGDILLCTAVALVAFNCGQVHWLARPHIFSFLFMIVCHFLLESWQRGGDNRLYLIPLLMLPWVNLHGGFLGGFLLLGAYLAGNLAGLLSAPPAAGAILTEKVKQLGATTVATVAASLFNPHGYHILLFPFRLVSNRFLMDHIAEFKSPDFHEVVFFKYLLLLLISLIALSRKTLEATELILVLLFTNMALYSGRYIPLFALITAPILSRRAAEAREFLGGRAAEFLRRRSQNLAVGDARATGGFWPLAALLAVILAICSGVFPRAFDPSTQPVAACEFLMKERIGGNVFNNDEFGDHLIYRGYPAYKVCFDGRSDMYGTDMMKEYMQVINFQPGWEEVLDRYRATWIFIPSGSRLARFLLEERRWVLIYSDPVADIFVKNLPQYRELIGKYRLVQHAAIPPEK